MIKISHSDYAEFANSIMKKLYYAPYFSGDIYTDAGQLKINIFKNAGEIIILYAELFTCDIDRHETGNDFDGDILKEYLDQRK